MLKPQVADTNRIGSDLPINERAETACNLAKRLETAGDYETAYEALNEFWPDATATPNLADLEEPIAAKLLLRAGALATRRAAAIHGAGDQDTAKNLLTQSWERFEKLNDVTKCAEARGELGLCYWREGAYDEARIHLREATEILGDRDSELRAVLLIRAGVVEVHEQRLDEALLLYNSARPLVEASQDEALKGSFHIGFGMLFRRLARPDDPEGYVDRALIEYAAASYHFEQAGNDRALARVENNLGYLYFTIGRYQDAHTHLDRARHIFIRLKDVATIAQVDETRARTLLAQRHPVEAERIVRAAVRTLERGDQQAVLAEAIATHGVALARLGNDVRARTLFDRAIEVATTAGDLEGAARVKLSLIEEMGQKLPAKDLIAIYRSAVNRLKDSQDQTSVKRLMTCGERLFESLERLEREQHEYNEEWEGFSLKKHVKNAESKVIERALREAEGSVTKAAKLLGFRHHQSLISLLNTRHYDLIEKRSVARKRRRHIVTKPQNDRKLVRKKSVTE
ncbi:MAG TPA: helix-turn-helix domain-containing protein [Pyrinomonadaceae bacterium]|nr:helix-turn-helix domain-containing protein [Pyrinomonadaceae bacterium]